METVTAAGGEPAATQEVHDRGFVDDYRVMGASLIGRGHALKGLHRDDSFALVCGEENDLKWWFAAVADGAGSRPLSRFGARAVTAAAAAQILDQLRTGTSIMAALAGAVDHARTAQVEQAATLGVPVGDLSCTLLCLVCGFERDRMTVATFQVGDGLIAIMNEQSEIRLLADSDDQIPGQTRFLETLTSDELASRFRFEDVVERPQGLLLATDGVADDMMPWSQNGPILAAELDALTAEPDGAAAPRFEQLLQYEKQGSFDDRTLVAAWRRRNST